LLGSAFPKPCFTQPDGCGNLAQRQSFASSIAAQGYENRLNCNRFSQPAQKSFFGDFALFAYSRCLHNEGMVPQAQ